MVSVDGVNWESKLYEHESSVRSLLSCGSSLLAFTEGAILANFVVPPSLVVNPGDLVVVRGSGETGLIGDFQLANAGSGILEWTATPDSPWLSCSPVAGSAGSLPVTVTASLSSPLAAGTHVGSIVFETHGVPSQTVTITVYVYEDDHANNQSGSTPWPPGATMSGNIQDRVDGDWFTFEVDAPGTLAVWTSSNLHTIGELHDTAGKIIGDYGSGEGNNFRLEATILPGRYWVRVDGYWRSSPLRWRVARGRS